MKRTQENRFTALIVVPLSLCGAAFLGLASQAQIASGSGTGLKGEYFANPSLTGTPVLSRLDSRVSFVWLMQSPGKGVPADRFSARWTGQLQAPVTATYTLSTIADDSVRVYLGGKKIIDSTSSGGLNGLGKATVNLTAGQRYDLTVEYVELTSLATVTLSWAYPGVAQQLIPTAALYPTGQSQNPGQDTDPDPGQNPTPENKAPTVAFSSPAPNAIFTAPAKINLSSTVTDPDGKVARVEFFAGGAKIGEATAAPYTFSWAGVTPGSYTLTAKATDNAGASSVSEPRLVTVNPGAGGNANLAVPANLSIQGQWLAAEKAPSDRLTWDPVPGAAGYNVYQYDVLIAKGVPATSYTVPARVYYPYLTYAVTAVDRDGLETIPSNIVLAQGAFNPDLPPPYLKNVPQIPSALTAVSEWNAGRPRVNLTWETSWSQTMGASETYSVYRDGVKVADGLWALTYLDLDVQPGETHRYQVAGANLNWKTAQESPVSAPVTATVTSKAPSFSSTPVTITSVTPNDDSVVVSFAAVPGAVDYRCYVASNPSNRKYSGGGLKIEMNGLNPVSGADLVVEALDKLGPFQKHDGFVGPGVMQHDGTMLMDVNGQGDPSNVPIVVARSAAFHVNCQPRTLKGEQVFFDTFRDSQPFVWAPAPDSLLPNANGLVKALQNDKWLLYNVQGDLDNSQFFVQGSHFMDTFYDGDRPGGRGPLHNNVASFLMRPKANADISNGKVLHVTFEVDPHMGPRRWCDLFVADANDPLLVPGKFREFDQLPTQSGNLFRWEIMNLAHQAEVFRSVNGKLDTLDLIPNPLNLERRIDPWMKGTWNGSNQDLDLRHKYDLYLSQNRFRIMENETVIKDVTFPAGRGLPFTNAAVYFVHQVYHTGVERPDLTFFYQSESYFYNYRPYQDERHWDNMGFEVLSSFPK